MTYETVFIAGLLVGWASSRLWWRAAGKPEALFVAGVRLGMAFARLRKRK